MEDEHADRVYVPGTNPTPPDRDVEPLWDDDTEAPVRSTGFRCWIRKPKEARTGLTVAGDPKLPGRTQR